MTTFLASLNFLAQDPAAGGGGINPLVLMVAMFALMYFVMIRPQRRQRAEHEARVAALKSGDKIVSSGGIYGLITNVKTTTVIVKIADNVRIELDKSCVASVVSKADEPAEAAVVETESS
jgi:preprotein translocase subunit YajC